MTQQIELTINDQLRLKFEKMKASTSAETDRDLINTALSLLELALDGQEEGKCLALIDATNKTYEKVSIAGLIK